MNKKKICAGSLALALSLGAIAPAVNASLSTTAYASEVGTPGQNTASTTNDTSSSTTTNENTNTTTGTGANNASTTNNQVVSNNQPNAQPVARTPEEQKTYLQSLVNEQSSIQNSARYVNASEYEKKAYNDAIANAKTAIDANLLTNAASLIKDIENKKLNLGANLMATAQNRDALRSTIAMAQKMIDKGGLWYSNREKLNREIEESKKFVTNPDKLEDELMAQNEKLAKMMSDIITEQTLDASKFSLNDDDLKPADLEANQKYANARARLLNLHTEAYAFYETNDFNNISNIEVKNNVINQLNNSAKIYNDPNSSIEQFESAFNSLNLAFNNAKTTINADNTEVSRLRTELRTLTGATHETFKNTDAYKNANKVTVLTYDQAIERGKAVAESTNASKDQLESAIRNINITKLSVKPVKTKTLDGPKNPGGNTGNQGGNTGGNATPQKTDLQKKVEELQALIDEAKNKESNPDYKNALATSKIAYDAAITSAKTLIDKADKTKEQVEAEITLVKTAKDGLKVNLADLKSLVDQAPTVKADATYTGSTSEKRKAYDDAITAGQAVLNKPVNDVKADEITAAVKKINDALTAINYKGQATSAAKKAAADALRALVNNENTVKENAYYKSKTVEQVKPYTDAIAAGKTLLTTYDVTPANVTEEQLKNAANAINKAITDLGLNAQTADQAKQTSAAALKTLTDKNSVVKESQAFKNADKTKQDAYTTAISEALTLLGKFATTPADVTKEALDNAATKINSALSGINYKEAEQYYPTALNDVLALHDAFVQSDKFKAKENSSNKADKDLAATYREIVRQATEYKNSQNPNADTLNVFAQRINDLKRAINGQMSMAEVNLRGQILNEAAFLVSQEFKTAEKNTDEKIRNATVSYKALIEEAKKLIANPNRTDAQQNVLANKIATTVDFIKKPTDATNILNFEKIRLLDLIRDADTVITAGDKYKAVPQQKRDALEKAHKDAVAVRDNDKATVENVRTAISDLEAGLNVDAFKKILEEAKGTSNQTDKPAIESTIETLVAHAERMKTYPTYKDVWESTKVAFEKALEDAKKAIASGDADQKQTAKKALEDAMKLDQIDSIYERVRDLNGDEIEPIYVRELRELLVVAEKVRKDEKFDKLPDTVRYRLIYAQNDGNGLLKFGTKAEVQSANNELKDTLKSNQIAPIVKELGIDVDNLVKETPTVKPNTANLENMTAAELVSLARRVTQHIDFPDVPNNQRQTLVEALTALSTAIAEDNSTDIAEAKTRLISALLSDKIKPITEKVLNQKYDPTIDETELDKAVSELKDLVDRAKKVIAHKDYKNVEESLRKNLERAVKYAEESISSGDLESIKKANANLTKFLNDDKFKDILEEVDASDANRQRINLASAVKADESIRKNVKFTKAQKALRDAYIKAIDEGRALLEKENATATELKAARENIANATKALDGDVFEARLKKLKEDFEAEKANISDANKKADLEKKINALEAAEATMDDLITVESELKNTPKLTGTTTPVTTTTTTTVPNPVTTGTTVTPVTTPTTTTTPVSTTVPATVNPGSIVRTGIESLVGVVAVLAVAVLAYFGLSKKNKNNNRKEDRRNENK